MTQFRILAVIALSLVAHLLRADVSFDTRFTPSTIAEGQEAYYVITLIETSNIRPPEIERFDSLPIGPNIGGIELRRGGWGNQSQRQQRINGRWSYESSIELRLEAVPSGLGTFTIPPYEIEYKGSTYTIPNASLTVVEKRDSPVSGEPLFFSLTPPEVVYVGQRIELQANLYVSERVGGRIEYDQSEVQGESFSINSTEADMSRKRENIGGTRYQVLSWPIHVTALRQGADQKLSATAVLARQRLITMESFSIEADPIFIDVLPLPTEGKPESFSGAIGNFQMSVSTDLDTTKTGEPIMLSLMLSGKGNFERIQGPALPDSKDWNIYDPEAQIDQDAQNNNKRFDYVMIPKRAGTLKTPAIKFSFFDPQSKEYIEYTSPPIEVKVTPGRQQFQTPTASIDALTDSDSTTESNLSRALSPEEALLTLDYRPKPARQISSQNPFITLLFLFLNIAGLLLLSLLSYYASYARRLRNDPDYAMQRAYGKELKAARSAAANISDAEQFYIKAQTIIRLALSRRTKRNLRNAELSELLAHLPDDTTKQIVTEVFTTADAQRFSQSSTSNDWKTHQTRLDSLLKAL